MVERPLADLTITYIMSMEEMAERKPVILGTIAPYLVLRGSRSSVATVLKYAKTSPSSKNSL
jgi:hypothetical protein